MQAQANQRAIDSTLFDWPSDLPSLLATRCSSCDALVFPVNSSCKSCGSTDVDVEALPKRGTLWTWSVQRFMPKTPYKSSETADTFKPFGVGYIELPGALRIESRLLPDEIDELKIGAEVELDFYVHRTESDGTDIINYAFKLVR